MLNVSPLIPERFVEDAVKGVKVKAKGKNTIDIVILPGAEALFQCFPNWAKEARIVRSQKKSSTRQVRHLVALPTETEEEPSNLTVELKRPKPATRNYFRLEFVPKEHVAIPDGAKTVMELSPCQAHAVREVIYAWANDVSWDTPQKSVFNSLQKKALHFLREKEIA